MNYPTPMDIAEHEDRDADMSAVDRLANICAALEEDLNESPFTREEWERLDAERLELLKANDALAAENAALRKAVKGFLDDYVSADGMYDMKYYAREFLSAMEASHDK